MPNEKKVYLVYWNVSKDGKTYLRLPDVFLWREDAEQALREKLTNHYALAWSEQPSVARPGHSAFVWVVDGAKALAGYVEEETLVVERPVPRRVTIYAAVKFTTTVDAVSDEAAVDQVWTRERSYPTQKLFLSNLLQRTQPEDFTLDLEEVYPATE